MAELTASPPPQVGIYRDRKRLSWIFSILVPMFIAAGPLMLSLTGDPRILWVPVLFMYGGIPLLDLIFGLDQSNPPESAVPALEADRYYRAVTYALVPLLWAAFIYAAWYYVRHPLPWHGTLALILTTGVIGGFCINLGHELGHKSDEMERWLAKLILAPSCYGHFFIEHNRGHHRDVATPEDSASSRMGESIYRFMLREMPGAMSRAWKIEADRLRRSGQAVWSLHNQFIQPWLITLALWVALVGWLGWRVLPFLIAASFWSNFQLTLANYIEHYGLLRRKVSADRYERCEPHHSWNSNHVFSNWATFHLQRHSDHHAHPTRRYQSLRHFEDAPQLPSGYPGMFLLAVIPPLWFGVMNPRLLRATGRDASRINFDPAKRQRLIRRYGLSEG